MIPALDYNRVRLRLKNKYFHFIILGLALYPSPMAINITQALGPMIIHVHGHGLNLSPWAIDITPKPLG